jgi:hypothetical protein
MSRNEFLRFAAAAVLAVSMGTVSPAHAGIKCWTNKDGIRECGNVVPPEYAQAGHETKSASGVTIEKTEEAKTIEELKAEREKAAAAAAAAASEEERAAEQAAADGVLLATFSSEDDLVLARDGKIGHLDSQIKLTESHIEKLERNLGEAIERAADLERRGEALPDKLTENIASLEDQITENRAFIETKRLEKQRIREKFDADIKRFRHLKGTP